LRLNNGGNPTGKVIPAPGCPLGVRGQQLLHVPSLVRDVVLDEKAKCHGGIATDDATGFEPTLGDLIHDCDQDLVFCFPPAEQSLPGLLPVAVRRDPAVLRIVRALELPFRSGPYKTLPIVGGRVEQVAHDLLPRPPSLTPRHICKPGGNR
jgi:hypothetical protein